MENNQTQNNNSPVKSMHTYASDMAEAVRDQQASIIKIAVAEQKKREEESGKVIYQKAKKSNTIFLFIGLIVIVLGFFGFTFINKKAKENSTHEVVLPYLPTLVTVDAQAVLDSKNLNGKEDTAKVINDEVAKTQTYGNIKAIIIGNATEEISPRDFFNLIQSSQPDSLLRTITDMTVGTYATKDSKNSLFFLFKTSNYDQAYASILLAEKVLLDDYFAIFNIDVSKNKDLFKKAFEDILIDNNDARVLKDESGNILLVYSFISKDKFIITNNIDTIREVTKRVRTQNIKQLQ